MNISKISAQTFLGKLLRLPLPFLPKGLIVPILQGRLRGYKWIAGSSIHGCWLGSYEYEKRKLFEKVVEKGSIVFDIGAHVGYYSLLASALVGPKGKVFAFEPLPRNVSYLKRHIALNRITNIEVLEIAVSDNNGTMKFKEGDANSMGHLSETGPILVKTNSLDALISKQRIPVPDYIKIDVEGAELEVLNGANSLLTNYHPTIFLSTHGRDIHQACCNYLTFSGYTFKLIDNYEDEILAFV